MIVLDDARILASVDQNGLLAALERAFRDPSPAPPRMHLDLPGHDGAKLLIMPSFARDLIGVKVVTVAPANSTRHRPTIDGLYILMDGQTGQPIATLSGPALTALRTAAVCALAASRLSRTDTKTLLVIGTGALVPHLVRAYSTVRALERVLVWGRDRRKAEVAAAALTNSNVTSRVAPNLADAIGESDIVCCATHSSSPLIRGHDVAPGTHVDLVGSFAPGMREADTDLFRVGRLAVDTAMAFTESGDLIGPLAEGVIDRSAPDLTQLLRSPALGRKEPREITVFKTVGTGLADLAAARYILEQTSAPDGAYPLK